MLKRSRMIRRISKHAHPLAPANTATHDVYQSPSRPPRVLPVREHVPAHPPLVPTQRLCQGRRHRGVQRTFDFSGKDGHRWCSRHRARSTVRRRCMSLQRSEELVSSISIIAVPRTYPWIEGLFDDSCIALRNEHECTEDVQEEVENKT